MKKSVLGKVLLILIAAMLFFTGWVGNVYGSRVIAHDPVKSFVKECTFYSPVTYKNLTIVPVSAPSDSSRGEFSTLDEAISAGTLTVKEVSQSGSVGTLAITNSSKQPVFIMAGEILRGSKQDRVLKKDVMIPAKSEKILVEAFCVEQGRWTYKSDKFYSGNQAANISVRQIAQERKSQSDVWDGVAATNTRFKAKASGSLAESYSAEEVRKTRVSYETNIPDIPRRYPKANGVVVLINGKVLVADIFSKPHVFSGMWKKLADSYILEAISRQSGEVKSDFTSASRFLEKVKEANITYSTSPGTGKHAEILSSQITGSALVLNSDTVHLAVFPRLGHREEVSPEQRIQRNYNRP